MYRINHSKYKNLDRINFMNFYGNLSVVLIYKNSRFPQDCREVLGEFEFRSTSVLFMDGVAI